MPVYYANKNAQSVGEHIVHQEGCYRMPDLHNRLYLGYFLNANQAVRKAGKLFDKVNACYFCSRKAHK